VAITYDIISYPLFIFIYFYNQQFITWGTRAVHGSYFVTTYIQKETTCKRKRKRKKKRRKKET